ARLSEEAGRASRARQDILSVVCHDLRNPLSIVRLGCKTLVESSPRLDPQTSRRQLQLMLHAAEQMDRMISDLLDVSSIEAGHLAIEPTEHSLKELVHDAFEMLSPFAQQKRLELRVDVSNETMVRCDRERVLQVFANLGGNAVKFAPAETPITLGADILNGMVRFSIEDRGPGIAPELMNKLFDRYSQARETAKKGRGLGLFISKGLVEAQGGERWAETQVGGGRTFFFAVPLAAAASETAPRHARPMGAFQP